MFTGKIAHANEGEEEGEGKKTEEGIVAGLIYVVRGVCNTWEAFPQSVCPFPHPVTDSVSGPQPIFFPVQCLFIIISNIRSSQLPFFHLALSFLSILYQGDSEMPSCNAVHIS